MGKETILVIEDDKNIAEMVRYNFEQEGFRVLTALKGDTGLQQVREKKPDLVILDLMLPGMDGIEICKILKQNYRTADIPIIMLTAKGEVEDRIVGLELGADDYVTKPFSIKELIARGKAVLRSIHQAGDRSKERVFKIGALELDTAKHVVTLKESPIELTPKEYDLLKILIEADGRVLSRDFIFDQVWGYDSALDIETRTLDIRIAQLRKKLKSEACRIVTVKNFGYRFDHES